MSRAPWIPALLLVACSSDGPPLSSLVDAWTARAVESAEPMVLGSLLLSGLSAQLCDDASTPWAAIVPGDPPPIDDALSRALGGPVVEKVQIFTLSMEATLSGVDIFGRQDSRLQIGASVADGPIEVELALSEGDAGSGDSGAAEELVTYARTTLSTSAGCDSGSPRVSGTISVTDALGKNHSLEVPSASSFGSGLLLDDGVRWLPLEGAVTWSSVVEGQAVTLETRDAALLEVDGATTTAPADTASVVVEFPWSASWGATLSGDGWSRDTVLPLRLSP